MRAVTPVLFALALASCAVAQSTIALQAVASTRASLRTTSNGWLEFCPDDASSSSDSGVRSNCIGVRLLAAAEVGANGNEVSGTLTGSARVATDLWRQLQVQAATEVQMNTCLSLSLGGVLGGSSASANADFCATAATGGSLGVRRMPLTVSLAGLGQTGAVLSLDAGIFTGEGTFQFGGRNYSCGPNTLKFDIGVTGYSFAAATNKLQLDFEVTGRRGEAAGDVAVNTNSSGYVTANGGALVAFPRYAVRGSASGAWTWQAASARAAVRGSARVLRFEFQGPFVQMQYDPTMGEDSAAAGRAAAALPLLLVLAVAAVVGGAFAL